MRPHLVRDIRILAQVLRVDPPKASAEPHELLGPLIERVSTLAAEALRSLCRELADGGAVQPELPRLEVFKSPLAGESAPLGVRTLEPIRPGRFLCFYPGRVFEPDEPRLPRSDKIISNEYEAMYCDGAGWLPLHMKESPLLADCGTAFWHGNRLAIGNLLNHPPAGTLPSAVPMAMRWPTWQELGEASPALWARLVPHVAVREGRVVRTASGEVLPAGSDKSKVWFPAWPHTSLALVAARALEPGEEVFFNYRMHSREESRGAANFPAWYHPVDEEAFEAEVARSRFEE
uniref:SET domain-containing protein n=1 Tax=Alexandrium catenella TaxID=2925 RepID=A0A7S1Q0Y0_ALECA|mmetsp:Transcript_11794/g.32238  ORF Transcript_11794/g.32238 Transcript_11794/m.32238 type:complete len:290 (+) Transcript_11794:49-918(+)